MIFRKKKGVVEKLKDTLSPPPSTQFVKEIQAASETFKKQLKKSSKKNPFSKNTTTLLEQTTKLCSDAKNAAIKTNEKHGKKIQSASIQLMTHTSDKIKKEVMNSAASVAAQKTKPATSPARKVDSKGKRFTCKDQQSYNGVSNAIHQTVNRAGTAINAVVATDVGLAADRWLRDTFSASSNVYDKAMDSARELSGHLGPDHRLFDGGHTLAGAWEKVRDALPDDTMLEQIKGYTIALKNDVVTPEGLPLITLNKDSFNSFTEATGINKSWARDMASMNGTELIGATVGAIALALNWRKSDISSLTKTASSLGLSSIAGANPLLAVMSLSALAYNYQKQKDKEQGFTADIIRGGVPASTFITTANIVGGPAWVGAVAGVAACVVVSKRFKDEDYEAASAYIKSKSLEIKQLAQQKFNEGIKHYETFKEAQAHARTQEGAIVSRAPTGTGFIVKK